MSAAASCSFPSSTTRSRAVIVTIQTGIPVARIELLDEAQMRGGIGYSKLEGYRVAPTLFYEFHGTEAGVARAGRAGAGAPGAWAVRTSSGATRAEERNRLWQARHELLLRRAVAARPGWWVGHRRLRADLAAGRLHRETRLDLEETGMLAPIVGHVGDGNFHLLMLIDPLGRRNSPRRSGSTSVWCAGRLPWAALAPASTGSASGKIDSVAEEVGPAVEVMAAIKRTLDPLNILNPGKVVRV